MLSEVIAVLTDHGWFDPASSAYDKTVYMTHGAAQTLLLSRNGQPECFVKFSERQSLALEARRCEAAARHFPDMAPPFIGYTRQGSLEVLATRAVVFRNLNSGLTRSIRHTSIVQSGLEGYFKRTKEGARPATGRRGWVQEYLEYFERLPWRQAAGKNLEHLLAVLGPLPAQDQHGDFVVNNLGIGQQSRLVVFDWEDYGAVDVPGLDLFTLEASLRKDMDEPAGGGSQPASRRAAGLDVDRMCQAVGLPRPVYEQLRLSYAFMFRFLKRNYGPDIRGRVDRLLHRLGAAAAEAA